MTDLSDVPRRGQDAKQVFTEFPAGWVVESAEYVRDNVDENEVPAYRMSVTAMPGPYASGNDRLPVGAHIRNPPHWFTTVIKKVKWHRDTDHTKGGTGTKEQKAYPYDMVVSYYHTNRFYDNKSRRIWLLDIREKLGCINKYDDDPFPGVKAKEWKMVAADQELLSYYMTKVKFVYEHAGTNVLRTSDMNWDERVAHIEPPGWNGLHEKDVGDEYSRYFPKTRIAPLDSTSTGWK